MKGSTMRRDSGGAVRARRARRLANAATRYTGKWLEAGGERHPKQTCIVDIYTIDRVTINRICMW